MSQATSPHGSPLARVGVSKRDRTSVPPLSLGQLSVHSTAAGGYVIPGSPTRHRVTNVRAQRVRGPIGCVTSYWKTPPFEMPVEYTRRVSRHSRASSSSSSATACATESSHVVHQQVSAQPPERRHES